MLGARLSGIVIQNQASQTRDLAFASGLWYLRHAAAAVAVVAKCLTAQIETLLPALTLWDS